MLNPSRNLINTTTIIIPVVLALVLIISSQLSFLLFHTLAEFFAIIVALLSAVVAWQMYTFTRNHFLMYLGCGYFWIASLDMLHTLSYEGLSILDTTGTNVAVQFWIGTRILEALLLLSSPWFLTRPVNPKIAISLFAFISVSLTALILTKNFPIGFIEGKGLTDFKIYSEYLIILMLAGAIYYLSLQRRLLDQRIFKLIVASIALTMMAELSFTFYVSIYGLSNISGHIFKLFSFWLIFIAVVRTTLREPFSAMSKAETHYDAIPDAAIIVDNKGIIQHVNKAACSLANLTSIELIGQQAHHIFHNKNENESLCNICNSVKNRTELSAYELEFSETTWFDISISPIDGEESL
ncbi:MAG: PAS domain-containing protein, partial [Gammaproteobacteria bacterium]|nr:PAS domain-containing protein [Gammaproteobacteria bacterium]